VDDSGGDLSVVPEAAEAPVRLTGRILTASGSDVADPPLVKNGGLVRAPAGMSFERKELLILCPAE
jgi:hypothetical protein